MPRFSLIRHIVLSSCLSPRRRPKEMNTSLTSRKDVCFRQAVYSISNVVFQCALPFMTPSPPPAVISINHGSNQTCQSQNCHRKQRSKPAGTTAGGRWRRRCARVCARVCAGSWHVVEQSNTRLIIPPHEMEGPHPAQAPSLLGISVGSLATCRHVRCSACTIGFHGFKNRSTLCCAGRVH